MGTLVTPAPGRIVRRPDNGVVIPANDVFELPSDPAWQRLFYVFRDLVAAPGDAVEPVTDGDGGDI